MKDGSRYTWSECCKMHLRVFRENDAKGRWSTRRQAKLLNCSKTTVWQYITMAEGLEMFPDLEAYKHFDDAWKILEAIKHDIRVVAFNDNSV